MRKTTILLAVCLMVGCSKAAPPPQPAAKPQSTPVAEGESAPAAVPETYAVEFDMGDGSTIVIDVHREWAPLGAARFYELVRNGYFTDVAFFRVIKGFMAQAGLHGDPKVNAEWRSKRIQDDPGGKQSNTRGMVSFATAGPNTRTTQFFINFGDNSRLDGMGFTPFGKVRDMKPVDAIYDGYGEGAPMGRGPAQGLIHSRGNEYLKTDFPKLSYIKSARILNE